MKKKLASSSSLEIVSARMIERRILIVRGEKVLLDSHLAELYGVSTGRLNEAVARNIDRFPEDFMFKLNRIEFDSLKSQIAISNEGRGGRRKLPAVFTEQGVAMLSSVLRSDRAVAVNIEIMRAFVKLRELLLLNEDLSRKLETLEKGYDRKFSIIFDAIRKLMTPPEKKRREIGFDTTSAEPKEGRQLSKVVKQRLRKKSAYLLNKDSLWN